MSQIKDLILKSSFPTPFFLYDFNIVKRQFKKLRKSLPSKTNIFYSVKTNPTLALLKLIQQLGLGVEITSSGELATVQKLGFLPSKIIFTGPGKTDQELIKAIKKGIYLIIVESLSEAQRVNRISQDHKKTQNILLRVNMLQEINGLVYKMSGGPQKFGIDEERIEGIILEIVSFKNIKLLGMHFYGASNILNYKIILESTRAFFDRIKKIEPVIKSNFPIIDIGGGIGVDYRAPSTKAKRIDIDRLGGGLKNLLKEYNFENRQIILEVGRFLVAEAGSYITRVIDIKESRGKKFVIVDGGIHLSRASLANERHDIEVVNPKSRSKDLEKVDITGALATPVDILSRNVFLPKLEIDDLIIINKTGAYGFTAGMLYFSSRPLPAEYALINGKIRTIRKKGLETDFFNGQIIPRVSKKIF